MLNGVREAPISEGCGENERLLSGTWHIARGQQGAASLAASNEHKLSRKGQLSAFPLQNLSEGGAWQGQMEPRD